MTMRAMKQDEPRGGASQSWLSLQAAAAHLGVHSVTLRRWADQGAIPHMVTPGGHRRFAIADLNAAARRRSDGGQSVAVPQAWAARAMQHARENLPAQAGALWMVGLSADMREQHRTVGRKLLALTLQYLGAEEGEHLLDEAATLGAEYGRISRESGIVLTDALRATLYFRDKLLEASLDLPDGAHPAGRDQRHILRRINALLNRAQIAIAEVYESGAPRANATRPRRKAKSRLA